MVYTQSILILIALIIVWKLFWKTMRAIVFLGLLLAAYYYLTYVIGVLPKVPILNNIFSIWR